MKTQRNDFIIHCQDRLRLNDAMLLACQILHNNGIVGSISKMAATRKRVVQKRKIRVYEWAFKQSSTFQAVSVILECYVAFHSIPKSKLTDFSVHMR